ncbi:MAG: SEL1-like repeat protein [Geminicoccaceae bacterium]|nr:SEL1-like repeat protein [Geminicoccaceae bacterium]
MARPVSAERPAGPAGVARGLRIVALAATLALVALVIDARSRLPPPEPVVLLPVPEAVPQRPARPFVPRPAPPPAAEPTAEVEARPETPPPTETTTPSTAPAEPSAPAEGGRLGEVASPPPSSLSGAAEAVAGAPSGPARPPPGPSPTAAATVRDGVLAYQAGDYPRAEAIWRPLAEAGNARARFHLGALYLEGRLGPPDPEAAYRWLALAAEAGQAAAAPLRDQAAARLPPERLAAIRGELGLLP